MNFRDAMDELIADGGMPLTLQEKLATIVRVLFHDSYGVNDRLKLLAVMTAANQCGFDSCENIFLSYAEQCSLERGFVQALIDPMMDLSFLTPTELACVQLVKEVGITSRLSAATIKTAGEHFTAPEREFIVCLAAFIHFVARLQIIGK